MEDQLIIGIVIALAFVSIGLGIGLWQTRQRLNHLLRGRDATSLESIIREALYAIDRLEESHQSTREEHEQIKARLRRCVKTPATLRFNPFRDAGGNQSFAVSLIDDDGTGVVISSMYSQGRTSVYAKPIEQHNSPYELTNEESHVLHQVKNQVL